VGTQGHRWSSRLVRITYCGWVKSLTIKTMNIPIRKVGWAFASILFALTLLAEAHIAKRDFKAGAYRGVIIVTTSVDDIGETTASIKVKGRSTGDSTLRLIGTPQPAAAIIGIGDESSAKLFSLGFSEGLDSMVFSEVGNVDAGVIGSHSLQSLSVKSDTVRADLTIDRTLVTDTVTTTVRIRLTRIGK
jgi:hypothetical protein